MCNQSTCTTWHARIHECFVSCLTQFCLLLLVYLCVHRGLQGAWSLLFVVVLFMPPPCLRCFCPSVSLPMIPLVSCPLNTIAECQWRIAIMSEEKICIQINNLHCLTFLTETCIHSFYNVAMQREQSIEETASRVHKPVPSASYQNRLMVFWRKIVYIFL